MSLGSLTAVTTWPVKSMGGGAFPARVVASGAGLDGDRRYGVRDLRHPTPAAASARALPGLLRWSAAAGVDEPLVTGPDGRQWSWSQPGLTEALTDDLDRPVELVHDAAGHQDLPRSVLITTVASHRAVEQRFGQRLEVARWRTNLHLDLGEEAFAEAGWEGRRLRMGVVELQLLHPCQRCSIPTYAPGGISRTRELLRWFVQEFEGPFGINARVEVPGTLYRGLPVEWA